MNLLHSTCALLLLLSPFALQAEETSSLEGKPICTRPFPLQLTNYTFSSSHGEIAVWDSGGPGTAVLLIHGNSSCKEIFTQQIDSSLTEKYRFIAIDLPGHGNSAQATDPEITYSYKAYSEVVMELIEELHLENPFIVGWSLGGYVALNALDKGQKFAGILLTGTPPIEFTFAGFQKGFLPMPELMPLWGKEELTHEEAISFLNGANCKFDYEKNPFILDAVLKTDGRCRRWLLRQVGSNSVCNAKNLVETNSTPLCIVQGTHDKVNLKYMKEDVKYKNLFNDKIYEIPEGGHAVFWEKPESFNAILEKFLNKESNMEKKHS